jgi:hypothetical protein
MDEKQNLEQIIDSDYGVAVLDTANPLELVSHLKRLTLTTGRAVYDWSSENGLYRLGIEHIFIPRTRTPVDVLAYITSSRHYGIYLLRDFNEALSRPAVERQLLKLLEKKDGVRRLVCLIGKANQLPATISLHATLLRWDAQRQARTV